jgi:protein-L-isoaspartate(D-aspartate) O-methyltransferase
MDDPFKQQRIEMVRTQIAARGVEDERVLKAMLSVPRERFVLAEYRQYSYEDSPVPIGVGQTISQPYMAAAMLEQLELDSDSRMLEVGSGSGYAVAVAANIAKDVYGVERHRALALRSREVLQSLGYRNVQIRHSNGQQGWPEHAPYDAILVSAGARATPPALKSQLKVGGNLVIPLGPGGQAGQTLFRITRASDGRFERQELGLVSFVPLVNSVADD